MFLRLLQTEGADINTSTAVAIAAAKDRGWSARVLADTAFHIKLVVPVLEAILAWSGVATNDDTIILDGDTYTFGVDFATGLTATTSAQNVKTFLRALGYEVSGAGATLTITTGDVDASVAEGVDAGTALVVTNFVRVNAADTDSMLVNEENPPLLLNVAPGEEITAIAATTGGTANVTEVRLSS